MRMQPLEMGNGGSVEEHGEWETSCGMAFFFYTCGLDAVLYLAGF